MSEINHVAMLGTLRHAADVRQFPFFILLRARQENEAVAEFYIDKAASMESASGAMYRAFDHVNDFVDNGNDTTLVGRLMKICVAEFGDVGFSVIIKNRRGE